MWRDTNSISELEFLAETSLIEINPNFKKEELKLICGTYGPFRPMKPVLVPLWLAVQFKKNKKCTILPPTWMDKDFLANKAEMEKNNDYLQELPYYFFEISQILFHKASEDIGDIKLIKSIIEDISSIRFAKINKFLDSMPSDGLSLYLNNICARELEQIRPFVTEVFALKLETITQNLAFQGVNGNTESNFDSMQNQNVNPNSMMYSYHN